MITRKSVVVIAAMLLFVVGLSACMPGSPMAAPDVEISMDAAVEGQSAVLEGLGAGSISLSNEQASSLVTELMKQNGMNSLEIAGVSAEFDGMTNHITLDLAKPIAGIDSLGVAGSLVSEGGVVNIHLDQAFAGGMGVTGDMLDLVASQINAQLAGMPMGLADGTYALTPEMAEQLTGMMMSMGLNSAEIASVKTAFDGGKVHIIAELAEDVMGVGSMGLSGAVSLDGGTMMLDLDEAFAGNMVADPGIVDMIGSQINANLGGMMLPSMSIDADGGNLMVGMGN